MMASTIISSPSMVLLSDRSESLEFFCVRREFRDRWMLQGGCRRFRGCRIFCNLELRSLAKRKCSPYLESGLLSSTNHPSLHEWRAVPDIWRSSAEKYGDHVALVDPYHSPPTELTYKELEKEILNFSEGLRVVGVVPDEKLALFADNSCRWLIADQGIMATGAINVVRGTRSSSEELLNIYNHSESNALVVDSPQFFNRLAESLIPKADVRFIVLLWGDKLSLNKELVKGIPLYDYNDIIELGSKSRHTLLHSSKPGQKDVYEAINPEDVAAIMYTSGTSGSPKGVMLTHKNLLHQIHNLWEIVPTVTGDCFLSMLPSWHAYERACEYFILTHGVEQVYTNVQRLRDDLKRYQPQYLISVPLVYETLYRSVPLTQAKLLPSITILFIYSVLNDDSNNHYYSYVRDQILGSPTEATMDNTWATLLRVQAKVSTMPPSVPVDSSALVSRHNNRLPPRKGGKGRPCWLPHSGVAIMRSGIASSWVLALPHVLFNCQRLVATRDLALPCWPEDGLTEVLGTIGHPLQYTEMKIVDAETGEVLPDGSKGVVKVKGPQVMAGYYKNPSATNTAVDEEGWFNSGDIGWIAPHHSRGRSRRCSGMVVIEGRAKDTIVLSTGENVEPSELEAAAMQSSLIQQIVVIGQDRRRLGALIVPNKDEVQELARRQSIVTNGSELQEDELQSLLYKEVKAWTAYFTFQIGSILVIDEPFTIDNGLLTPTMKIRRDKVVERYREQIEKLYN
ncbi:probable acyl-activating enzyme 16, chloroplastic [Zingiber officinale]|uniref:probable acyl-activating enzyme 16, chloroplastic n=1 Tax=Zingiber officinale TaxID=94328 RepID=UPI001C4C4709|nr:probable acyl-activating enzyme 16, chloroplastic [Zingiber officinale]